MKLEGRKALVTGSSRGIGAEIAFALAEEGADVAVNYCKSEAAAQEVVEKIRALGRTSFAYRGDTSVYEEVEDMKRKMDGEFGRIDILVNNAGINLDSFFTKMTPEAWRKVLAINLDGVFNCTKVFLNSIIESEHGRIVNISSIVGEMGNIGQCNYAASKAGIIGFTKALAREMARHKVTVNAIAPGFISTAMVEGMPEKVKEKVLNMIPLRRFGLPREVARAVVYLVSDDAEYITGHVLNINGGLYM
jgi:3-oxoacyl-[acyl-carrier protein] reductase